MKQNIHPNHHRTVHQRIEQLLRHRVALLAILGFLGIALLRFDYRAGQIAQQAYTQGFGWIGTYMHHEHPTHAHLQIQVSRAPTISGSG